MKKIILIILLAAAIIGGTVHADTSDTKSNSFYYLFHLYYDNGQLLADRDFQFKYDVIPGDFVQGATTNQFPYRGEIIDAAGEVAAHFVFDPRQGDANFTKGKISVQAPYVADGQRAVFYNAQNQPMLTVYVSDSSFCNDDGICNSERGEDSLSCPKDCKQTVPVPPVASPTPTPSSSSGLVSGIIYGLVGVLILVVLLWVLRKRKNSVQGPLPTPPPPPTPGNPV
jgi:hypothetical protein